MAKIWVKFSSGKKKEVILSELGMGQVNQVAERVKMTHIFSNEFFFFFKEENIFFIWKVMRQII